MLRSRQADYLLIDVSNSFTKIALASKEKLGATQRVATEKLSASALRQFVRRAPVERVVVSSVVPKKNALIRKAAGRIPITFVNAKTRLGVGIDYPDPRAI